MGAALLILAATTPAGAQSPADDLDARKKAFNALMEPSDTRDTATAGRTKLPNANVFLANLGEGLDAIPGALAAAGAIMGFEAIDRIVRDGGGKALYCQPVSTDMRPAEAIKFLRDAVIRDPKLGTQPWPDALFFGLRQTYPCK